MQGGNSKRAPSRESWRRKRRRKMSRHAERIAIIGGTGDLGFGLALRLAKTYSVTIGSRDPNRAAAAAKKATALTGARVEAKTNGEATGECEIAILAVP